MQVSLISLDSAWENRKESFKRVEAEYEQVIRRGKAPKLILLPEMFSTGFTMNIDKAVEKNQISINFLSDFAQRNHVNIIAGICEYNDNFFQRDNVVHEKDGSDKGRPFNQSIAIDENGDIIGKYSKRHLFPLAGEEKMMQPGNSFGRVEINGFGILQFICYDLRFPEDFRAALKWYGPSRIHAISVIANWPASRDMHWRTLLRARAIENQCYVLACNRRGRDGNGLIYCGSSMVIGPDGTIIKDDEKYLPWITVNLDMKVLKLLRKKMPILDC